jgi:hypothetical protein
MDVFVAETRSNTRDANHRKRRFSIVARVRFRGMFTESLPSNELFSLSGIMSQHILNHHYLKLITESVKTLRIEDTQYAWGKTNKIDYKTCLRETSLN